MPKSIAVLGAGSWGTAVAQVQAKAGHRVRVWDRDRDVLTAIRETGENGRYHPGLRLSANLTAELELRDAIRGAEIVFLAVPSHGFRDALARSNPILGKETLLVNAAKGLDEETEGTLAATAERVLGLERVRRTYATLSGPSFAAEVMRDLPTALTVAAFRPETAARIQESCHAETFRLYSSDDVVGVELAGALKNVIAIVAGAVDGLGFGHNARAGVITLGLAEIARIGRRLGAHPLTFAGLAGMGDLVLTCTGDLSRNRQVGLKLAQGKSLHTVMKEVRQTAEGIRTAKTAHRLATKLGVDAPILAATFSALYERKPLREAVQSVLARAPEPERA